MKTFDEAKKFIYRNARPLELARWRFYFEGGAIDAVLDALACYQNEDGGFGHALEADCWNPNSSPIQTWYATHILREIGFADASHPLMQGALNYLANCEYFNGRSWPFEIPSNNDFPHARWWHCGEDYKDGVSYNPSASLAGFWLRYGDKTSDFYKTVETIARDAVMAYMADESPDDHEIFCYIELLNNCAAARIDTLFDANAFTQKLVKDVHNAIEKNTDIWATSYVCKPSFFLAGRDSIFYASNKALADYECAFIEATQLANGTWPISWRWSDYPDEYAVSANWWQSSFAVNNMLYLKGFGKLS